MNQKDLEQILREKLAPVFLEIRDRSEDHAGHASNTLGGGHYQIILVSEKFAGMTPIERHRLVYQAVAGFWGSAIHALALQTFTPEEWSARK